MPWPCVCGASFASRPDLEAHLDTFRFRDPTRPWVGGCFRADGSIGPPAHAYGPPALRQAMLDTLRELDEEA